MINPFDRATEISIEHPKKVLAIGFVSTLLLSSMAMFLEFDNSEDAFFPDNETVQLLDEVEGEHYKKCVMDHIEEMALSVTRELGVEGAPRDIVTREPPSEMRGKGAHHA